MSRTRSSSHSSPLDHPMEVGQVSAHESPAGAKGLAQLSDLRFAQRRGSTRSTRDHETRCFFELLEQRHRSRRAVVPRVGTETLEHHRTDWSPGLTVAADLFAHEL